MLPCQRKTRSQSKMRRSHQHRAFTPVQSVRCPNCSQPKLPHAACGDCGYVRPGLKLKVGKED